MPVFDYNTGMDVNDKDQIPETGDGKSGRVRSGKARMQNLSPEERKALAQKAARSRWGTSADGLPRATHEGSLVIGGIELQCAVLEDGTRVLSRAGFIKAMGRTGKAKGGRRYDSEFQVPVFVAAGNLKPFISDDLLGNSAPMQYRPIRGGYALGYRAALLPLVCHAFEDAKEAGVLQTSQVHIAQRCKILSRGFSVVGITALVDEATGYQEVRDRKALEAILDAYLRKELAAWAKRFPDEFYKEIFRLKEWAWDSLSVKRPGVIGRYTNDLVYERLAPGIIESLEKLNPKNEKGNRRARHHQWLTEDVGHPALAQHLHAVLGLMRASKTWEDFYHLIQLAFPKKNSQLLLPGSEAMPSPIA